MGYVDVLTGSSFRPAPIAKTFGFDLVVEFQYVIVIINAFPAATEPQLYQRIHQIASRSQ
jgi:hypothetical protein